ncbi:MAG TPA: TIM barrel protein [Acidimicrobiia bacterium]|nr:TIM barrel protein [Acidimicrobiia bacterium]
MELGRRDLVLCSGTLPRDASFRERVDAARDAGFRGLSMWGRDYASAREEGHADADIRAMLDDAGLAVAEIDPAWWWLPGAAATGAAIPPEHDATDVFRFGPDELFRIAEVVGARSLNAVDVFGGGWSVDDAAESFADLCDRAAEHGLRLHVEFLPWSRIPDLATAVAIVTAAGRANGGVMVDSWHFTRSNSTLDELRATPGDLVFGVQLNDGPASPEADLVDATLHARRLPGEGDFDLAGLVGALDGIGADAPYGVEVFSDDLAALGPAEAARRAAEATRRVLAGAR